MEGREVKNGQGKKREGEQEGRGTVDRQRASRWLGRGTLRGRIGANKEA